MPASPPIPASSPVRDAIADLKVRLRSLYGDRLDRLILYGSHVRGGARPDSDVDLLVLLRGPYEPYTEIRRMGPERLEVELRYDVTLSLQPYGASELDGGATPFLAHVATYAREV